MTHPSKQYDWTFEEVRQLDATLAELKSELTKSTERDKMIEDISDEIRRFRLELNDLKHDLTKKPVVIDNRERTDWKAMAILIGATVAAAAATAQQVFSGGN